MPAVGFDFNLNLTPFARFIASTVQDTYTNLSTDGKRDRACRIVIKASGQLSHIQPTLDDGEKAKFCRAIDLIKEFFQDLEVVKNSKEKREITDNLMKEVRKFEMRVKTTSALKMAAIAIEGREARAYKLFKMFSTANKDPIKVLRYIKAHLQDGSTSDNQESHVEYTADEQLQSVDVVMDGLEQFSDAESFMYVESSMDVESFMDVESMSGEL